MFCRECAALLSICYAGQRSGAFCCNAGKTIHINHFIINDSWYLVDLPGYG